MHYTKDNPPDVGARVMIDGCGPYTVLYFSGVTLTFLDRPSPWKLWANKFSSKCRDATPEELESAN